MTPAFDCSRITLAPERVLIEERLFCNRYHEIQSFHYHEAHSGGSGRHERLLQHVRGTGRRQ